MTVVYTVTFEDWDIAYFTVRGGICRGFTKDHKLISGPYPLDDDSIDYISRMVDGTWPRRVQEE